MIKKYLKLVCLFSLLFSTIGYSQTNNSQGASGKNGKQFKVKWSINPFKHQVFIENKGQFDGIIPGNEKVFFAAQLGKVFAYFTANGIVYGYKEFPKTAAASDGDKDDDAREFVKPIDHFMACSWVGANPLVTIDKAMKLDYYYTYPKGINSTIKTDIYKKITYKNIYPNIDIEYTFPKDKDGLEYSIIVHPGGDVSMIKLNYPELKDMKLDKEGNMVMKSDVGEITDHSPKGDLIQFDYDGNVNVGFELNGNTVSFKVDKYNPESTLVIDPWITDPLFTTLDRAYDLDYDNSGNVYALGGQYPYQCVKIDPTGNIMWTYNTSFTYYYYGDIVVDHHSQNTYITEGFDNVGGAKVFKINTLGSLIGTFLGNNSLQEMWRAVYNPCNGNILIGTGGTNAFYQACMLDTTMTTANPVNILSATVAYHDIAFICMDPSGAYGYVATAHTLAENKFSNEICKLPVPTLSPTTYIMPDYFNIQEVNSVPYVNNSVGNANGMNGMAASPNWLYMYDGASLKQFNKTTGVLNDSVYVTNLSFNWGGLDVDACDNIFLGAMDSLKVFKPTMKVDTTLKMPGTVYDLALGQNDLLYLCGDGFVSSIQVPALAKLISRSAGSPTSCSACNGTASVTINCGIAPFKFLWSNGSTDQTDTGLCAGIYTVTVTDAACPPHSDTAIINISGKPGYGANIKDTNPNCALSKGNITVYPYGGTSPYSFLWNNGATTQKDTGLIAGTYICVITDSGGCRYSVVVNLVNPVTPTLTIAPGNDSICNGSNIILTASGLKTYNWTPNIGLTCYNCPNPTASPTATTTYTINAADSNGCTASSTVTIKVFQAPKPIITGKDSVCSGYTDTLKVTGGTTYTWSTGATTTSITRVISTTTTYTVTAKNGLCTHDTTITIHVISPAASIIASKDSVCQGDSILLTASGGSSFVWSNGKTSTTIWVTPSTTTTYTLHATAGTCSDSATKKINIFPLSTIAVSKNDTICPNQLATFTATGSGGNVTYKWSNGATTSSITVTDTATRTFTATVYGRCDSAQKIVTLVVIPLQKPVIKGSLWKCRGIRDTLTVSGGTSYKWNNGSTKTTYITGNINQDSSFYVVAYNSRNCPDTTRYKVTVKPVTTGSVSYAGGCSNTPIVVTATGTGSGPFTYKWKPGGQTSDTIDVSISSSTTYTVTISDGCPVTKTITVKPIIPNVSACCPAVISIGHDTIIVAKGSGIISYSWQPSVVCKDPPLCDSVVVTPTVTTTYTVIATDSMGCESVHTVTISIECFDFIVPNVITPTYGANHVGANGGTNNLFYIETKGISNWSTLIYDRWGKEMFKTTNPNVYWDGKTEGGADAVDGVYYYIISGTCGGNEYKKQGFLQLIR